MSKLLTFSHNDVSVPTIRARALVFDDAKSAELLARVEQVAPTEATVLIIGETGTGKELLARHIHANSRRTGPFVAVNCGAFSEALVDAELFGHEAGAFTGATHARQGWFEAADGGTLFLDEIGDLPLPLQVKLLRVLQERQVVRIGSRRAIPIDVRLIAATNIDLRDAVELGRFRPDLYFRLGIATLQLPPLCERPADILPLARHFLQIYASRLKLSAAALAPDAEQALLDYDWPGNIRELENAIHYALIVSRDGTVRGDDLRSIHRPVRSHSAQRSAAPAVSAAPAPVEAPRVETADEAVREEHTPEARLAAVIEHWLESGEADIFDRFEEALIRTAFAWCDSNQVQTAKLLGLSRNVLRTYLKRHHIFEFRVRSAAAGTASEVAVEIGG